MSTDIQELTAADVGISSDQQIDIVLRLMISNDGKATTAMCYEAVERMMEGARLSQQGKDTLRSLISRDAVGKGWVYPYDGSKEWRITEAGRNYITGLADPEGSDDSANNFGDYPIDSLLIRTEQRTVFDVIRRINNNQFILDPDFQRDFVWDLNKQSKLIESTLLRIPLPVFYLAENNDGKIVVVDGLQRLTTFRRFLNNEFALRGLSGSNESLNKKFFKDLEPKLQNRIEDTQLILYLIDSKVPDRAKLDIFDRVNSGVALSRQQMRNCLHVGDATRWLRDRAESEIFKQATGSSLNTKTMRDREAINRFCAFYYFGVEGYRKQGGNMDDFLAEALTHMNRLGQAQLARNLTPDFERSMRNNLRVFGKHAFRRHTAPDGPRSVLNIALFDVYSILMIRYSEEFVDRNVDDFRRRFYQLQREDAFREAITYSTNDVRRVEKRFNLIEDFHIGLLGDIK